MAGMKDFDDPGMFGSEAEEYASDSPLDLITDNLGKIIAVIVILAVAFFAYDYFIASVKDVSITVDNTEENGVNSSIKIYASGATEPVHEESGKDSFNFQLRAGEYNLEVDAPNYKKQRISLSVDRESGADSKLELEKDIDVEIESFSAPEQIIQGETLQAAISFKNTSSKTETISLVVDGGGIELESAPEQIVVPAKGTAQATITISVPDGFDAGTSGKNVKPEMRILFLNEKEDFEIKVLPTPEIEIEGNKTQSFDADAGDLDTTEKIKVDNKSNFDITDLILEIEITDTENNKFIGTEKIREWFQFVPNESPDKWQIAIPVIEKSDDVEFTMYIKPPITAKEDIIIGNLVVSADYLPVPKKIAFQLEIGKSAEVELDVNPKSSLYDFEIGLDSTTGEYEVDRDQYIDVKNSGSVEIRNINIVVSPNCEDWIGFTTGSSLSSLKKGESKKLYLTITVSSGTLVGTEKECEISYFYDDPLGGSRKQGTVSKHLILKTEE